MVERDNWAGKFDTSGNAVVPASTMPSIETVSDMVVRGENPTAEITRAFADDSSPSVPAASKDSSGKLVRPDWGPKPVTVHAQEGLPVKRKSIDGIERADWDKPRDAQGQFITKSADELRQTWEREGGYEFNLQRAQQTTQAIVALAGDDGPGLVASVDALPSEVQPLIHDLLRLQPTGNPAVTDRIIDDRFRRIPRQHKPAVKAWWDSLTENQVIAIFTYFDGKRR